MVACGCLNARESQFQPPHRLNPNSLDLNSVKAFTAGSCLQTSYSEAGVQGVVGHW